MTDVQCRMLQNYAWAKGEFRAQSTGMDFNVKEYQKFIDGFLIPNFGTTLRNCTCQDLA